MYNWNNGNNYIKIYVYNINTNSYSLSNLENRSNISDPSSLTFPQFSHQPETSELESNTNNQQNDLVEHDELYARALQETFNLQDGVDNSTTQPPLSIHLPSNSDELYARALQETFNLQDGVDNSTTQPPLSIHLPSNSERLVSPNQNLKIYNWERSSLQNNFDEGNNPSINDGRPLISSTSHSSSYIVNNSRRHPSSPLFHFSRPLNLTSPISQSHRLNSGMPVVRRISVQRQSSSSSLNANSGFQQLYTQNISSPSSRRRNPFFYIRARQTRSMRDMEGMRMNQVPTRDEETDVSQETQQSTISPSEICDQTVQSGNICHQIQNNNDLEEQSSTNICTICLHRKINMALGCGHTLCDLCALKIRKCHICRKKINMTIKIYLN